MRFYLDSNVFISLIRSEVGKGFKLMNSRVEDFFGYLSESEHELVLSSAFFKEVVENGFYSTQEVIDFFKNASIKFDFVEFEKADLQEINKLDLAIHFTDKVHVFLAVKSKSDAITTWNLRDFEPAKKLVNVMEPCRLG